MLVAATAMWLAAPLASAEAHGENDARLIVRGAQIGPYTVSLWNVLGDASSDLPAHIIVMTEGVSFSDESVVVVDAGGQNLAATPSATIDGAWETITGIEPGTDITLRVADAGGHWTSQSFAIPHPLEPNAFSRIIASFAVFVTTAAAYWLLRRTAQVWRRPVSVHAGA